LGNFRAPAWAQHTASIPISAEEANDFQAIADLIVGGMAGGFPCFKENLP
jgi:hypothetical protein